MRRRFQAIDDELQAFVECFSDVFRHCRRTFWCTRVLQGLISDLPRKSIEPMAAAVPHGNVQAMQEFVSDSRWDEGRVLERLREIVNESIGLSDGVWILDDTSLPKQGRHSVGVAHQYCGALGKIANCQSLVSWHFASSRFDTPLNARLFLPQQWANDDARLKRAHVPSKHRQHQEKWRIALDLADEMAAALPRPKAILADAAYGSNRDFLRALDERALPFAVQTSAASSFWPGDVAVTSKTVNTGARPRKYDRVVSVDAAPRSADAWAQELFAQPKVPKVTRVPIAGRPSVKYVAIQVYEAVRTRHPALGPKRWLIVERRASGELKYYVSNQVEMQPAQIIKLLHRRWQVEQGYRQLKDELGLDHFEGRSWRGLHHHVTLCFMAYAYLQLLAHRHASKSKKTTHAHSDA